MTDIFLAVFFVEINLVIQAVYSYFSRDIEDHCYRFPSWWWCIVANTVLLNTKSTDSKRMVVLSTHKAQ